MSELSRFLGFEDVVEAHFKLKSAHILATAQVSPKVCDPTPE